MTQDKITNMIIAIGVVFPVIIKQHAINIYAGVDIQLHAFLTLVLKVRSNLKSFKNFECVRS